MSRILVSGLTNIETTLKVDKFPVEYVPCRFPFFGVNSSVSGVGYNISKALTTLGTQADFLTLIGSDMAGQLVIEALRRDGLTPDYVVKGLEHTAQSVILYASDGQRAIFTDLKDIQEAAYPAGRFEQAINTCEVAVLCNINFSRPFLQIASRANKLIATDVHAIGDLEDPYNRDFMQHAHILFMSHESLPCPPEEWLRKAQSRYRPEIAVVGMGSRGALMAVRGEKPLTHIPAVHTRPVVNTIGAGDALFSAFIHFYHRSQNPYEALQKAVVFASYKIGETGAAAGFLTELEVNALHAEIHQP